VLATLPNDPNDGIIAAAIARSVGDPEFAVASDRKSGPFGKAPEKVRKAAP